MTETSTTQHKAARIGRPDAKEFVAVVGPEARRLARQTLWLALASLGAAALSWYLWFSSFLLDSPKSFLISSAMLVAALAPGAFLFWLRSLLAELSTFPGRLGIPERDEAAERGAPGSPTKDWKKKLERAKVRLQRLLKLWSQLGFAQYELAEALGGRNRALAFLGHSASPVLVICALLLSSIFLLGALLSGLGALISWMF